MLKTEVALAVSDNRQKVDFFQYVDIVFGIIHFYMDLNMWIGIILLIYREIRQVSQKKHAILSYLQNPCFHTVVVVDSTSRLLTEHFAESQVLPRKTLTHSRHRSRSKFKLS